jgi:RNA polymerase sigma-70 factor (ECF subfamily)
METKPSDEQLMGSLAGGDDRALGELMKRWEARVHCFVSRMCGYLGKAEDICQDVWTRIFLSRSRFDRTRPFGPFLFAVAANCCRTEISRARHNPYGLSRRAELVQQAHDDPSALCQMVWREQCQTLHHAIYRLPEMQRAVVLLYLLMDGSYRQVAQALVISEATARSHMSHAIRALRGRLDHMSADFATEPEPEVKHDRSN